jgi:hypothetical protein
MSVDRESAIEKGLLINTEVQAPTAGDRPVALEHAREGTERSTEVIRPAIKRLQSRPRLAVFALGGLLFSELLLVLLATAHRWKLVPNAAFAFRSGVAWPTTGLASWCHTRTR